MGKGDKKSRRGKILMGSYGNKRPSRTIKPLVVKQEATLVVKAEKPKKAEPKAKVEELPKVETPKVIATDAPVEAIKKAPKKAPKKVKDASE